MKTLSLTFCLVIVVLFGSVGGGFASDLPDCPSDETVSWHNCFGSITHFGGDLYVGEWKNDLKHGKGTYTYPSGDTYIGEFKDNVFNGQGVKTYTDGTVEEGIWKNNEFHQSRTNNQSLSNFGENHLLFSITDSFDYFAVREQKDEFDNINRRDYEFGCSYKLKVTNNTSSKVYIYRPIIQNFKMNEYSVSHQYFEKVIEPGKSENGRCTSCRVSEIYKYEPDLKLSDPEIFDLKEKYSCTSQENKIFVNGLFNADIFKFPEGSKFQYADKKQIVRVLTPLVLDWNIQDISSASEQPLFNLRNKTFSKQSIKSVLDSFIERLQNDDAFFIYSIGEVYAQGFFHENALVLEVTGKGSNPSIINEKKYDRLTRLGWQFTDGDFNFTLSISSDELVTENLAEFLFMSLKVYDIPENKIKVTYTIEID